MPTFERLLQETAREHALRTIKENIIHLELPPGSHIGKTNWPINSVKSTDIIRDHDWIVTAIRQRDPVEAHKRMDVHLRRFQPDIRAIQTVHPEYFK